MYKFLEEEMAIIKSFFKYLETANEIIARNTRAF